MDTLASDDSLAFCPTVYNRAFTLAEARAKSELRVRLVPLNMLKLSSFFFLPVQISSIYFLNVKNLVFTPYCGVCVVVVVVSGGGGGGGGQDVISIQTSTMTRYRLQYHVCRPVWRHGGANTNAFHSHNACWLRARNNNGNGLRR